MDIFIDNKYTRWYFSIIDKSKSQQRKKSKETYFESHHIIPKSFGGPNIKDNLILLTYKEHFLCHWLLTKMCQRKDYTMKMKKAFFKTVRKNHLQERSIASWRYEIAKKQSSAAQTELWKNEEYKEKQKKASSTEEYKRIKSEKSKKNWENENYRNRVISTLYETNQKPEVKERRSKANKEANNRPDVKEKNRQGVIDYWKDAERRKKHIENIRKSAGTYETRKRNSEAQNRLDVIEKKRNSLKITNQKPEVKERRSNAAKEFNNRPETKKAKSERMRKLALEGKKKCPHCSKEIDPLNAMKWHFDRCRNK